MADRQDPDREVLTSLPRSRPVRRSAKRGERPAAANGAPTAPASGPRTRTTAAHAAQQRKQQPDVAPKRKVPPAGYAAPTRAGDAPASGAADLVATTVQAAVELTQIGLTIGRQTLQSMLDRLPKP